MSVVVSTAAASVGDALRALEQADRLTSDFVLVSADVVANVDLRSAVRAHRERRQRDRCAIATLLVRGGVTPEQRLRLGVRFVVLLFYFFVFRCCFIFFVFLLFFFSRNLRFKKKSNFKL